MTSVEQQRQRVHTLRAECSRLRVDIDDPVVLSEYTVVLHQLAAAERELAALTTYKDAA